MHVSEMEYLGISARACHPLVIHRWAQKLLAAIQVSFGLGLGVPTFVTLKELERCIFPPLSFQLNRGEENKEQATHLFKSFKLNFRLTEKVAK